MKNGTRTAVILAATLFLNGCYDDAPDGTHDGTRVEILNNRAYAGRTLELLNSSRSSVCVVLYVIKYDGDGSDNAVSRLVRSLSEAKKRGVDVKVLLDSVTAVSYPETTNYLLREGVPFRINPASVTTHAKLLVIDDNVTVIGSHNWTYSAAEANNETSAAIFSGETARMEKTYFNGLYDQAPQIK